MLNRMKSVIGVLFSLFSTLLVSSAAAEEWEAGEERAWHGLGQSVPLQVFVPRDYVPERAWPIIYWFHGTGGRSGTRLMQRYTAGRGFILVGAPYAVPGEGSLSRQGILAEVQRISRVRELLGRSLNLDGRLYVGGFSKGGWMADLLASEGFPGLAGALILGAGRIPDDVGRALEREERGTLSQALSIYIGIGQLDTNHVYSRRAVAHYRRRGHGVVFEEYWGRGHQPGDAGVLCLTQWLRLQVEDREVLGAEARRWWAEAMDDAETMTPPIERFLFLEQVSEAPFARLIEAPKREELRATLQRVKAHRALKTEMEARDSYESAQAEEEATERSDGLPAVAGDFHRVYRRFPQTFFGQRAALDIPRVSRNYQTLRREGKQQDEGFPRPAADVETFKDRFSGFGGKLLMEDVPN